MWAAFLLLPGLGAVLWFAIVRCEVNPAAIPVGMATPAAVALLKLLGQAWGRWAKEYERRGGPPRQGSEPDRGAEDRSA